MLMEPIKVFIIDDDFFVRQATTSLLTKDERTEVIGTASSLSEALATIKETPTIFLLDMDLKQSRESGVEAIGPLKEAYPETNIWIAIAKYIINELTNSRDLIILESSDS